ncbi:hypothetical protein ACFL4G_08210 [Thermodesulfobacteriota bacterium]
MNDFQAKRIVCSHEERIEATPEKIFPLACPVEELKWIDGWQYDLVFSESGVNEYNCIFDEGFSGPALFNEPVTTTWVTSLHDRSKGLVQFVLVASDRAIGKFDVSITGLGNGESSVRWDFTITSMKEAASNAIDETTAEKMQMVLAFLASSLKHYCETGEILKMG